MYNTVKNICRDYKHIFARERKDTSFNMLNPKEKTKIKPHHTKAILDFKYIHYMYIFHNLLYVIALLYSV